MIKMLHRDTGTTSAKHFLMSSPFLDDCKASLSVCIVTFELEPPERVQVMQLHGIKYHERLTLRSSTFYQTVDRLMKRLSAKRVISVRVEYGSDQLGRNIEALGTAGSRDYYIVLGDGVIDLSGNTGLEKRSCSVDDLHASLCDSFVVIVVLLNVHPQPLSISSSNQHCSFTGKKYSIT
ncbi:hypothetical protein PHET_05507 [Paragonimus heterotremus]|uniref:Uncharacterized protein n=1 Tax=Paragonimus heterotremus TaxID=100268 RepID=A0A8J4SP18_9TREM|nr:hypothetical protein PHET_05507 [Paragonimus heterotremus]